MGRQLEWRLSFVTANVSPTAHRGVCEVVARHARKWAFEADPIKMAEMMIEQIDIKRKALGIDKARERVLYDMEMRRDLT